MKYYENEIYPIALVLSNDLESVRKEYWWFSADSERDELPDHTDTTEATTYVMRRKTEDYRAIAVGIVFNVPITFKLAVHEGFHATRFIMNQVDIPLDDSSDEAYAYLFGWIADCIEDFKSSIHNEKNEQQTLYIRYGDIPKEEKSAIWKCDECVGYEKGVSVYEAHKNANGRYVPVIPFPSTDTTMNDYEYHLNYFRGRKYLVNGDLLNECGSSGEPLIKNVKIVDEIK